MKTKQKKYLWKWIKIEYKKKSFFVVSTANVVIFLITQILNWYERLWKYIQIFKKVKIASILSISLSCFYSLLMFVIALRVRSSTEILPFFFF